MDGQSSQYDAVSNRNSVESRATEVEAMIERFKNTLPVNARPYFVASTANSLHDVIAKLTPTERVFINMSALVLFPLMFRSIYLNSTERVVVLIAGKHKILQGPGLHWVSANMYDRLYRQKYTTGQDIIQGPIKLLFVQPGTLKYVWDIQTSRPMLLSPGMHYFDDINIQCEYGGPEEIVLNSDNGENKIIQFGQNGIFRFVFVKTGYKGIVATREGTLRILDPGLHFVEAPDSFRLFAHVQREHFSFGHNDVFLTADNVELNIEATLFYQIKDVAQVFTTSIKDESDMKEILLAQAKSTLMTIVRSENFASIGKRKMTQVLVNSSAESAAASPVDLRGASPSAPPAVPVDPAMTTIDAVTNGFQSIMHDAEPQFRNTMQTTFGNTFGLEIIALRIEKIEFADKKMQKQVSESAIGYTTLAAQEATIAQQMKLKRAEADRDAAKVMIEANAEANKNIISVEAKSKALVIEAEAKSRIAKINAEADANAEVCKLKTIAENNVYVSMKNAESLQIKANADAMAEVAKLKAIAENNVYVSQKNAESLQIQSAAEASAKLLLAESEAKSKRLVGDVDVSLLRAKNDLAISTVEIIAQAQVDTFKNTEKQIIYSQDAPFLMHKMNEMMTKFAK